MTDEKAPEHTQDDLQRLLAQLTTDQIRFVVARQEFSSDKDTAEALDISPNTVKNWKYGGAPIDEAIRLMVLDGLVVAAELRRRHLAKAMAVKVKGLDEDNKRLRQSVATEIIEWEMGKPTQRSEIRAQATVETKIDGQQFDRAISTFADALGEILSRQSAGQDGSVDPSEQAAMAGPSEPG